MGLDMGVPEWQEKEFDNYCRMEREKSRNEQFESLKEENKKLHDLIKDIPTIQVMSKQISDLGIGLCNVYKELDELKQTIWSMKNPGNPFSDEPLTAMRAQRQF